MSILLFNLIPINIVDHPITLEFYPLNDKSGLSPADRSYQEEKSMLILYRWKKSGHPLFPSPE
jgi:hypothetical protein